MSDNQRDAALKVQKIFSYIRELTLLRTPPAASLKKYPWSLRFSKLPKFPTIQTAQTGSVESEEFDGIILKVKRPEETPCPPPPPLIKDWIEKGWEDLNKNISCLPARNSVNSADETITILFEADPERVQAFNDWRSKRDAWKDAEKPVREAGEIFANFFKLKGQIQRESEKYQLYIGDGHLAWESPIEKVDHPVLLKKVELEYHPEVPEFIIREGDDESEPFISLLRHHQLDGNAIRDVKKYLDENEVHPLGGNETESFLKFFIQRLFQDGKFCREKAEIEEGKPCIHRDLALFLGHGTQGFTESLDKLIEVTPDRELPESLMRIVGVDVNSESNGYSPTGYPCESTERPSDGEVDFLATKPINEAQKRVVSRLEQHGSVLVQGPPGTGKSHTIANIIGHLLAQGKTVLVSSHTSKALKVVREKVVKDLQPLCVSVLENDVESKSQLQDSIKGIIGYLSKTDEDTLSDEIDKLKQRRESLRQRQTKLELQALEIRKGEYEDIIVSGEGEPPSSAARKLNELEREHGWIPGPVTYGAPMPLTESEVQELYATNMLLSKETENCLLEGLPDLSEILKVSEMNALVVDLESIDKAKAVSFSEFWEHQNQSADLLKSLSSDVKKALEIFVSNEWLHRIVEDGKVSVDRRQVWYNLIDLVENITQEVGERQESIFKFGPTYEGKITAEAIEVCENIISHLRLGNSLNMFSTALRPTWRRFLAASSVDDGQPTSIEHFESVLAYLETAQKRVDLIRRWKRQVVALGGPELDNEQPEVQGKIFISSLKRAVNWSEESWDPIVACLNKQGFNLSAAMESQVHSEQLTTHIGHVQSLVRNILAPALESRIIFLRLKEIESLKEKSLHTLKLSSSKEFNVKVYINNLITGLQKLDTNLYRKGFDQYIEIKAKHPIFLRRRELLGRIDKVASNWSKSIELRSGIHGQGLEVNDLKKAWQVTQWRQEIDRRLSANYDEVQREIQRLKRELDNVSSQYVEKLAWSYQFKRTGLEQKQALHGWQQLQSRITKTGRGKRDNYLKKEARSTLKKCKDAVPVWIMPLTRVYENFDLINTKFDVLILDEASQSDVQALVAFAIAKQVIIVGDNEQVTPDAVGQNLAQVQTLIDELLQGVPNHMLYDGKTSIYDLAAQSFGEVIRLVEHFRCVPDIIEFSNRLSYKGEIKPLREASDGRFSSHLISHRVLGAHSDNKKNIKEAEEIVSLVVAMAEFPEYRDASMGIISLVGDQQACLIENMLMKHLSPEEYERHNLLCGSASQFQGDERDVILLSMVDTCDKPPIRMRQDEIFRKRFNVAVSRAKDQLWLIHSLNPDTDLQAGDLRKRLIDHIKSPRDLESAIEVKQAQADPRSGKFEPLVIKDLMEEGFRVTPQYEVGAYTIDIVVEGKSKRIAIECDGDKYHTSENLERDIQRQMILERLGWEFIRIRGTEYFRNRSATISKVIDQLDEVGIERQSLNTDSNVTEVDDDLKLRVLQRAFEIRESWHSDEDEQEEASHKVVKKETWPTRASQSQHNDYQSNLGGATAVELRTEAIVSEDLKQDTYKKFILSNQAEILGDYRDPLLNIDLKKLADFLLKQGFEIIDRRSAKGALWVVDSDEFRGVVGLLKERGVRFIFAAAGSKTTSGRAAWYTKQDF